MLPRRHPTKSHLTPSEFKDVLTAVAMVWAVLANVKNTSGLTPSSFTVKYLTLFFYYSLLTLRIKQYFLFFCSSLDIGGETDLFHIMLYMLGVSITSETQASANNYHLCFKPMCYEWSLNF